MRRLATLKTFSIALLALAAGAGCSSDPSPLSPVVPLAAKAPPNGDIIVTGVDPTSAPQDTTLDIKVSGSNFDRYSSVVLGIDGVASPNVKTNATRYVNPGQLVANITISADADVTLYDVMVLSTIRKPGIGTELFAVRQTGQVVNPTATFTYYTVAASATGGSVVGDGRMATGSITNAGESVYDDGRCNVTSQIFENIRGDATMDPIGAGGRVRNCDTKAPRTLTVAFGLPLYLVPGASAAGPVTESHYSNVREVTALQLKGHTGDRGFRLMLRGSNLACDYLRYEDRSFGGYAGMPIRVTRIASRAEGDTEDAWEAAPQPVDGRTIAFCEKGGTADNPSIVGVYDVSFRIRIVRK